MAALPIAHSLHECTYYGPHHVLRPIDYMSALTIGRTTHLGL